MIFLAYSSLDSSSIETSLGVADYSYYFVMQRFLPLLREFGEVMVLDEPPTDEVIRNYQKKGDCLYLSFTPPDKVADISLCPAIPVFAWEFSNIPYEAFTSPEDNWVEALRKAGRAITHSSYAAGVVRAQVGCDYQIPSIPAPLWDSCGKIRSTRSDKMPRGLAGLDLRCTVIDSACYEFSNTFVRPRTGQPGDSTAPLVHAWEGEPLEYSFGSTDNRPTLIGFNEAEPWGVWSRSGYPWIMLDQTICGDIELEITVRGYAHNVGAPLRLELGTGSASLLLSDHLDKHRLRMRIDHPTNFLAFVGVGKRAVDMDDPRDIGMGLSRISIRRVPPVTEPLAPLVLDFTEADMALQGFHEREPLGRWTSASRCIITIPDSVMGEVDVKLELFHMLHNAGRVIEFWVGDQCHKITLKERVRRYEFSLSGISATAYLCLDNLGYGTSENAEDDRELGLGIARISIIQKKLGPKTRVVHRLSQFSRRVQRDKAENNILYTAIFNPKDGRKNWEDIVTAFVYAFRETPHATLLVKITNNDLSMFYEDIFTFFIELHPFQCRLVFIHGYLPYEEYEQLLVHSHYIVNASRGEGQCLPLMEFMSSGVPAIAPRNTAMRDYIDSVNAFVVDSAPELTYWPHDPRQVFRTYWHRIDWQSLCDAFKSSELVARERHSQYREMSTSAVASLQHYCSMDTARDRFRTFLNSIEDEGVGQ
jgi:glycosyltransferase involved in cell wall biosynthesis